MCGLYTHRPLGALSLVDVLGAGLAAVVVVPPGQRGAEPLHFTEVDKEGAVGAIDTIEGVARVRGPACSHPLKG